MGPRHSLQAEREIYPAKPVLAIDEDALVAALRSGSLAGAGLDVFAQEPPRPDHPLFAMENVVVTPHSAGPTWESWPRRFANAYANVERVAAGEQPLWVIPELR